MLFLLQTMTTSCTILFCYYLIDMLLHSRRNKSENLTTLFYAVFLRFDIESKSYAMLALKTMLIFLL